MQIHLSDIIPAPLADRDLSASDVWGKKLKLDFSKKYHISAPSGTGKTSLLGLLYGIRKDFTGELVYEGFKTWDDLRRNKIAVVFQDLLLLDDLTVGENISLKNNLHDFFSSDEIVEMMKSLGIIDLKDRTVEKLSRGERQRVAIIRALCMPFNFLLLDEPFSHLDEVNTKKSIALIQSMVQRNKAGLLVTNLFADDYFQYDQTFHL